MSNDSATSSSSTTTKKAKKEPGNAASTPDAQIQRDNHNETNNPNSKMSTTAAPRSGFIKTNYGSDDKGTVFQG